MNLVCVCLWPFDEVFQSTPVLLHFSQGLLCRSAVTLQFPPAFLQLTTLTALLLQLVLQLNTDNMKGRSRCKIQWSQYDTALKGKVKRKGSTVILKAVTDFHFPKAKYFVPVINIFYIHHLLDLTFLRHKITCIQCFSRFAKAYWLTELQLS